VYRAEDCIVTALLHDTLDDGDATLADVEALAGTTVAALVSTVARLSRNNQLLRRAYRRMIAAGEKVKADAEIEAMKSMILQMTEEPVVRSPLLLLWCSGSRSLPLGVSPYPFHSLTNPGARNWAGRLTQRKMLRFVRCFHFGVITGDGLWWRSDA
jgi:hypothetical protein